MTTKTYDFSKFAKDAQSLPDPKAYGEQMADGDASEHQLEGMAEEAAVGLGYGWNTSAAQNWYRKVLSAYRAYKAKHPF